MIHAFGMTDAEMAALLARPAAVTGTTDAMTAGTTDGMTAVMTDGTIAGITADNTTGMISCPGNL